MKCPFNKKCEECHLNTKMFETDKDGNSVEVYKCAIYWTPILLSEISNKLDILIKPKKE